MSTSIVLSTDQVPPRERTGYWGDLVWRSFGRLRSDTWGDERFSGRIERIDLGGVRLCRLEASRHRVRRTVGADGNREADFLKLVVQHRGRSLFEQNGRRAWLEPGQFAVYDTNASYSVSNPEAVEQHVLLLPREPILQGRRSLESLLVRPLSSRTGLGRLACEAIRIADEESRPAGCASVRADGTATGALPALGSNALPALRPTALPALRPELGDAIVRLVHLALVEQLGERLPETASQLLLGRIRAHVDQSLGDPRLGPDSIARALNCSKRLLHKAFENEGTTLKKYILQRRLSAVREDLTNRALSHLPISQIAFERGFNSAAHFSRCFRARFGISPSDWRAQQGWTLAMR